MRLFAPASQWQLHYPFIDTAASVLRCALKRLGHLIYDDINWRQADPLRELSQLSEDANGVGFDGLGGISSVDATMDAGRSKDHQARADQALRLAAN
jgi:hypothetical protein